MIRVYKGLEPKEWTQYRKTPGAVYQSFDFLTRALLEEQGYLCAYCMRRIPHRDKVDGKLTQEDHRIEHIKCRERYPDLQLEYANMVVCCPGHIGDEKHCDKSKDDDEISFSPMEQASVDTIAYRSDGRIFSTNTDYDKEINHVLNLNTALLVRNRRSAIEEVIRLINTRQKGKPWTIAILKQYISKYSSKHNNNGKMQYIPYCGIVLYYLNKKLNQCK